ncbi:MAG TPA: ATP-binding protein [Kofleriaceae bacterium]|nr:ATP-binding protein [Kofleriaceae bacterium]
MRFRGLFARADVQTTVALLVADLMFRLVIDFPAATMWTLDQPALRDGALARLYMSALVLEVVWIAAFHAILAPIERWRRARAAGTATPAQLEAALRTAYHAPQRLTLAYAAQWSASTLLGYFLVRAHLTGDLYAHGGMAVSLGLSIATVALGSAGVAFTLTSWRLGPVTEELSVAARAAGLEVRAASLPLRQRVTVIALLLSGAPSSWVAALTCSEHFASKVHTTTDPFNTLLPYVLLGCAMYAVLCAVMFAATLTGPLGRMRGVVDDIVRRGEVADVDRLPVRHHDEVGALAEGVNEMIDRLGQVEQARRRMAGNLAMANTRLEEQVRQRTQSLEETNAQLRREIGERERIAVELRLAQKLESIGRLASGVAHEINTPVQYVTDSLSFVRDALGDLQPLLAKYRELHAEAVRCAPALTAVAEVAALADEVDVDYVLSQLTPALDRSLDGLARVKTIVRSMKQFAHPDRDAADVDLNETVTTTLEIARHEYKYVADVETELGDVPQIRAYPGELGQVVLNLVVNAAHAIGGVVGESGQRGKIRVKTWAELDDVWFSVSDTGGGIPEAIRGAIFDPFFTTKEVGRGTGQGLAIVHGVVSKLHGDVRFTTQVGEGTTFTVRLPTDFVRAASG